MRPAEGSCEVRWVSRTAEHHVVDAGVQTKRKIFRFKRSSKAGEQRQPERAGDALLNETVIAAASQHADASSDSKALAMPERLLDSTDAASTTRSGGSSTPDARAFNDGGGLDSSRPSSRQSANAKDEDVPRKPSRHVRRNSWLEFLGLAAKVRSLLVLSRLLSHPVA